MEPEKVSLVAGLRRLLKRPSETLGEFAQQINALDNTDRQWYAEAINAGNFGIVIDEATVPKQKAQA